MSVKDRTQKSDRKQCHTCLTIFEVAKIAVVKGIKSHTELLVLANQQKQEGKTNLVKFILNTALKEVVAKALEHCVKLIFYVCATIFFSDPQLIVSFS